MLFGVEIIEIDTDRSQVPVLFKYHHDGIRVTHKPINPAGLR